MIKQITKVITEGKYAAEVEVKLLYEEVGWSPYLSLEDAKKLDAVRMALRRNDVRIASRLAKVYQLVPVAA
jgi:hypothetical protein